VVSTPKWRKFDPTRLFKAAVCSLASLFIKQGSLLRATETLAKLPVDANEELSELAQTAFDAGQFSLASDIYQKTGCVKQEVGARLALILKSPENSKQTVADFSKLVQLKLPAIDDSSILLRLANFFQDKDVGLTEKLLKKSGLLGERVRFSLAVLHDFDLAEKIFEESAFPNQQAACLLADFLVQNQSLVAESRAKAVRFLLLAGRKTEALKLSFEIDAVDIYCRHVQSFDEGEAQALAKFYIAKRQFDKAGKFFLSSGQYEKALLSFVKAKDFDSAIDLVFRLHDDELFDLMVQVFAGETVIAANDKGFDGYPDSPDVRLASGDLFELIRNNPQAASTRGKSRLEELPEPVDPIYLFKLYLRFGKVDHANTIALAIIDRELIDGSYKSAFHHSCTVRTMLIKAQAKAVGELRNKIIVLHSYMLVKKALKLDNHTLAALLLNRVCSFLHYLPKNDTDILTSAVIEATKSGFKGIAYNWALTLCKPQYRSQINPKFKEKIEKIALKPVSTTDLKTDNFTQAGWLVTDPKALSGALKCPCCNMVATDAFALSCGSCFNNFVMCIATAKAILKGPKNSFVRCKSCCGVAYEAELRKLMSKESDCPVCEAKESDNFEPIDIAEIVATMKD
jgi:tetratricopeptide (TPR) repeat protein